MGSLGAWYAPPGGMERLYGVGVRGLRGGLDLWAQKPNSGGTAMVRRIVLNDLPARRLMLKDRSARRAAVDIEKSVGAASAGVRRRPAASEPAPPTEKMR